MAGSNSNNRDDDFEESLRQFIDARMRGEEPDIDELLRQFPEYEDQIRQKLRSFHKIDALFDTIVQPQMNELEDPAIEGDLIGQKIEGFEIVEIIGRGGMGVVYLAHDTRLKRSVAIKSIPAALADDSTARMRFKREAELLASLNHPNIAVIHDIIEQEEDTGYLVLEYVPGQTLAQRIARKPLKLQEALSISRQIAEAVSAAHNKGIIHRDLKPGNIKITPDGRVKVLDFGLAKVSASEVTTDEPKVTQPGRVMGTPAYMSPEQARSIDTDHRTDIWSFGCILYEMLTGHLPFEGKTATDILARILEREPDWELLPQNTPANIRVLIRRCLEKDPHRRLQHIGDAAIEISETLDLPAVAPPIIDIVQHIPQSRKFKQLKVIGAICLFLLGTCTGIAILRYISPDPEAIRPISRFFIRPSSKISADALWSHALAISPDGKQLVYVDEGQGGGNILYVRDMDDTQARLLPGTEGALNPFFSPDGQWLGFYDPSKQELKKIAVTGGAPTSLCKPENCIGASWGPDNTIIFSSQKDGLWRYTAFEGMERLTIPDPNHREIPWGHISPQVLPGGKAVLFTNRRRDGSHMEVLFLRTGQRRILLQEDGFTVRYVPTGHLVFVRDNTLFAVPFDIDELKVKGSALPVVEGIYESYWGTGQFDFSESGTLVYVLAPPRKRKLVWVDRQGVVEPVGAPPRAYTSVRVSPDGNRFAVSISPERNNSDIWILDKARLTPQQLTFGSDNKLGIWTPDSKRVIFTNIPGWEWTLSVPMWIHADRSGKAEQLAEARQLTEKCGLLFWQIPCLSPDGKYLLGGTSNIGVLPMESEGDPWPFIRMDGIQKNPAFSPDGHWVAYDSDETGHQEIYVCPFPGPGGIIPISTEGGYEPLWSRDGKELFYRCGDKLMAVSIEVVAAESGPELKPSLPQELFKGQFYGDAASDGLKYDLDSDGRFIMIQEDEESSTAEIHVVLNWFEELKRLVPTEEQ